MHYQPKLFSNTLKSAFLVARFGVVKVFFVGTAAIVADKVKPISVEHRLLDRFLLVGLVTITSFIGASPGVLVDQYSFDDPHLFMPFYP